MTVLDRDLVVVSGPDTFSFLQSLVSQDLDPVADGDVVDSLLLTPQGKLEVAFRLVRVGDDAWLDTDAGYGGRLAAALDRFRIRVKAEVEDRSADWGMVAGSGVGSVDAPESCIALPGGDVIGPAAALIGLAGSDPDEYQRARVEVGAPAMGAELDDKTIPQEAFLERAAVSFSKGCFLGQELVCRIDTRGHVNRYLRRLDLVDRVRPEPGAEIRVGDKVVGAVTSVTPPDGGVVRALGYVRREIDVPAEVVVAGPDGSALPAVAVATPASS